jgi:hypothetical protein
MNGDLITIVNFASFLIKILELDGTPAADIRESGEGTVTITPIDDTTRLFATEEEANNAALAMAIEWMNAN